MRLPICRFQTMNTTEKFPKVLAKHIRKLIPGKGELTVLVVGLGNRDITPDCLGTGSNIQSENLPAMLSENMVFRDGEDQAHCVSGLVPGVMAQTGMETLEIIKGVVDEYEAGCR